MLKSFFSEHFARTTGQIEQIGYRKIESEYLFRFLLCRDFKVSMVATLANQVHRVMNCKYISLLYWKNLETEVLL